MSETRTDSLPDFRLPSDQIEKAHAVVEQTLDGDVCELTPPAVIRDEPVAVRSLTNSPRCEPQRETAPRPKRRLRKVRVDAWAEPASVSWTRHRTTVRKVSRSPRSTVSCSTDWALPF